MFTTMVFVAVALTSVARWPSLLRRAENTEQELADVADVTAAEHLAAIDAEIARLQARASELEQTAGDQRQTATELTAQFDALSFSAHVEQDAAAAAGIADVVGRLREIEQAQHATATATTQLHRRLNELATERTATERQVVVEHRAALASDRMALAKVIDAAFDQLTPKLLVWRQLFGAIENDTIMLKEPLGRQPPGALAEALAYRLRPAAPELFDQTDYLRGTTFEKASARFVSVDIGETKS